MATREELLALAPRPVVVTSALVKPVAATAVASIKRNFI